MILNGAQLISFLTARLGASPYHCQHSAGYAILDLSEVR